MTYIKNILEVNDLVFDKPHKPFKKKEADKLFDDKWMEMEVIEPPKNDSKVTLQEINEITHRREMLSDFDKKVYINTNKDTCYYIKEHLDSQDLEYDLKDIERITDSVKHIGRYFKNKFNRPRPRQVAEKLGLNDFTYEKLETTNSPAYPSNHALQARMVAHYYGEKYPSQKKYLLRGADMSSEGRINAGVHYPSDKHCAYEIADILVKYFKTDKLNEDAPVNATGSAVSTDAPIVKKKKKHVPNLVFDKIYKRKF